MGMIEERRPLNTIIVAMTALAGMIMAGRWSAPAAFVVTVPTGILGTMATGALDPAATSDELHGRLKDALVAASDHYRLHRLSH